MAPTLAVRKRSFRVPVNRRPKRSQATMKRSAYRRNSTGNGKGTPALWPAGLLEISQLESKTVAPNTPMKLITQKKASTELSTARWIPSAQWLSRGHRQNRPWLSSNSTLDHHPMSCQFVLLFSDQIDKPSGRFAFYCFFRPPRIYSHNVRAHLQIPRPAG